MKGFALPIQFLGLIAIAVFAGVMLNIYTGHLSFWKKMPPNEFLNWFSDYSSGITKSTGPLGMLSMALPLISIIFVWNTHQSRVYWIISLLLTIGVIVITMLYFIKTNTSFGNKTIEINEIQDTLNTWGKFHLVRICLAFLSVIFAGIGILKYLEKI